MDLVLPPDASLEEIREMFGHDEFAALLYPTIEEARPGYARVSMDIRDDLHLNGLGGLMGGVPFVLSDFAFAIASNVGNVPTMSVSSSIDHLSAPKDKHLVAECEIEKDGRSLCFASIHVKDGTGRLITRAHITGFRRS